MNNQTDRCEPYSCQLIQDLMPSVIDGIASPDSQQAVQDHIQSCNDCAAVYEAMQENAYEPHDYVEYDGDYLKQIKKKYSRKTTLYTTLGILSTVCLSALVAFTAIKPADLSRTMRADELHIQLVTFQGEPTLLVNSMDRQTTLQSVSVKEQNDQVHVEVIGKPQSDNSSQKAEDPSGNLQLSESLSSHSARLPVYIDGELVCFNGHPVSSRERHMIEIAQSGTGLKNNVADQNQIAVLIGLDRQFGTAWTQYVDNPGTDTYGISFYTMDTPDLWEDADARIQLKKDAALLFALDHKAEFVTVCFDSGSETYRIERDEVNIPDLQASSPQKTAEKTLQAIREAGLEQPEEYTVPASAQPALSCTLYNFTSQPVKEVRYELFRDGKPVFTGSPDNRDPQSQNPKELAVGDFMEWEMDLPDSTDSASDIKVSPAAYSVKFTFLFEDGKSVSLMAPHLSGQSYFLTSADGSYVLQQADPYEGIRD